MLPLTLRGGGVPSQGEGGNRVETVSASASTKNGAALVSLTNLDADEPVEVALGLRGATVGPPVGRLLSAPSMTAHNTPARPDDVRPGPLEDVRVQGGALRVLLLAHSFATVRLPVQN